MTRVPHALSIEKIQLRVRGEFVGIAYGSENWFRAQDFLQPGHVSTALPAWITSEVWDSLIAARRRLDADVPLTNMTKGSTQPDAED